MNTIRRSVNRRVKKRALVIVNPQAASVSRRLKNLVVYALQGRYNVEAVDTSARSDATMFSLETRRLKYDLIVAFGGDGTFNEVVNGVAGTGIPVTVLPGGSANVACRALGIPTDIIDATEHLLGLPDDWRPRQVSLGKVDGRRFFSSCGAGIDAAVIKQIDDQPQLRAKLGPYLAGWAALSTYLPPLPLQSGATFSSNLGWKKHLRDQCTHAKYSRRNLPQTATHPNQRECLTRRRHVGDQRTRTAQSTRSNLPDCPSPGRYTRLPPPSSDRDQQGNRRRNCVAINRFSRITPSLPGPSRR